ncbi:hypothetical protein Hanom_Chr07g00617111 [Helianthus anomalus]
MPYTNLTFAAFLTLAVEDVHLPKWCRRSEVRRLLSIVISVSSLSLSLCFDLMG